MESIEKLLEEYPDSKLTLCASGGGFLVAIESPTEGCIEADGTCLRDCFYDLKSDLKQWGEE